MSFLLTCPNCYELQRFADHVTDWEHQEYLELH
jgi:hypothetical protein